MANAPPQGITRQLCRLIGPDGADGVPDSQLLERFVTRRDEAAFELLVWRHRRLVLGVCRRVLRDAHEAEDAFQATFLALARKAGAIGRRTSLAAWLCRVAFRAALRAQAAARRRPGQAPPDLDLPAPAADEPDNAAMWRELRPLLDREIDRLPEKYRIPVVLCYLEGRTYAETARQLGYSAGTVSTRLTKARELLRRRLARRGLGLTAAALAAFLAEQSATARGPAALVGDSVRAAVAFAADGGAAAGAVPARVAALTEGVLRAMLWNKVKVAAAVIVAAGLVVAGARVLTPREARAEAPADEPPAPSRVERAPDPPAPQPPQDEPGPLDKYLAAWEKAFSEADTLAATVTRVDRNAASLTVHEFTGTLQYRKPNLGMLELHRKDRPGDFQKLVCAGRRFYWYQASKKEVLVMDLPERAKDVDGLSVPVPGRPEKWVDAFLAPWCPNARDARRRYEPKLLKDDAYYVYIGLTPRTAEDRDGFRRARLVLSKDTGLPRQLWYEQPNGISVTWDVLKMERNVSLPEKTFTDPVVPPGWKLVRPGTEEKTGQDRPRPEAGPPPDGPPDR